MYVWLWLALYRHLRNFAYFLGVFASLDMTANVPFVESSSATTILSAPYGKQFVYYFISMCFDILSLYWCSHILLFLGHNAIHRLRSRRETKATVPKGARIDCKLISTTWRRDVNSMEQATDRVEVQQKNSRCIAEFVAMYKKGIYIPVRPPTEHPIQWRTYNSGPKDLRPPLVLQFMWCRILHKFSYLHWTTLQFCNVWCMEHYYEHSEKAKVSEDIGLSQPYTTSKAYYQTVFGLRILNFCLQDTDAVRVLKDFHKVVLIKALVETVLTRNN